MKKNLLKAGIGVALGGALLITSTFIGLASGPNGYDTLKSAVKNFRHVENGTLNITGTMYDNNELIAKVESTLKGDHDGQSMSGTLTMECEKIDKSFVMYASGQGVVIKDEDSDVYNLVKPDKKHRKMHRKFEKDENLQMEKFHDMLIDTLVGDLKHQVEEKDLGNGDKQLSISLNDNEIPSIINVLLSIKHQEDEELDKSKRIHEILGIQEFKCPKPELVSDIKAKKIEFIFVVDKNDIVKKIDAEFGVEGRDIQGETHDLKLDLSVQISDVNNTVPETIDLEGKNVREIDHKEFTCD